VIFAALSLFLGLVSGWTLVHSLRSGVLQPDSSIRISMHQSPIKRETTPVRYFVGAFTLAVVTTLFVTIAGIMFGLAGDNG